MPSADPACAVGGQRARRGLRRRRAARCARLPAGRIPVDQDESAYRFLRRFARGAHQVPRRGGAVGPDYPIVYRFSQWKASDFGASIVGNPVEMQELLGPLVDAGVDVFHPSTRRHYAPAFPDADPVLSLSGWTKKVTGAPVIAVGSVGLDTAFRDEGPRTEIAP